MNKVLSINQIIESKFFIFILTPGFFRCGKKIMRRIISSHHLAPPGYQQANIKIRFFILLIYYQGRISPTI